MNKEEIRNGLNKLKSKLVLGKMIVKNIKNWERVFLNYFSIIHDDYIIHKLRNGQTIKIKNVKNEKETSGLSSICEIFFVKTYCPRDMKINKGDTIIDIGANIGIFTTHSSFLSEGKVYSYEPFKIHFKRLLKNIKANQLKNVVPFNLAVCGSKGKRNLFINKKNSGMHSLIFKENSEEKTTVKSTTLKEIFEKNDIKQCDFLKMDCEGSEYEILYHAPKNILKKIRKISLEFDNIDSYQQNCFQLKKFLEDNDFIVRMKGAHQKQGILYAKKKVK